MPSGQHCWTIIQNSDIKLLLIGLSWIHSYLCPKSRAVSWIERNFLNLAKNLNKKSDFKDQESSLRSKRTKLASGKPIKIPELRVGKFVKFPEFSGSGKFGVPTLYTICWNPWNPKLIWVPCQKSMEVCSLQNIFLISWDF